MQEKRKEDGKFAKLRCLVSCFAYAIRTRKQYFMVGPQHLFTRMRSCLPSDVTCHSLFARAGMMESVFRRIINERSSMPVLG